MFQYLSRLRCLPALFTFGFLGFGAAEAQEDMVFPTAPERTVSLSDGTRVDIYNATVTHAAGATFTLRYPHGGSHVYVTTTDFAVSRGGELVNAAFLNPGDEVSIYVTSHEEYGHQIHQIEGADTPSPMVAATANPQPMAAVLPATASQLPLLGLLGALSIGFGTLGLSLRRRFARV